ncbi:hypothetical protein ABTX24_23885 [Nocardioides sp. NPDC127514]|uniref:hypothetical protein n=1 Tax=unclassified Nocardioides TaxID=2615069 RepID=UPI003322C72B
MRPDPSVGRLAFDLSRPDSREANAAHVRGDNCIELRPVSLTYVTPNREDTHE